MSSNTAELQNFKHSFKNPNVNSANSRQHSESSNANSGFSDNHVENSNANLQNSDNSHQSSYAKLQNLHTYDDIINTPYPFPPTVKNAKNVKKPRERIPLDVRAAEFAPFAALTGYNEAVDEVSETIDDPNKLTVEFFPEENQ